MRLKPSWTVLPLLLLAAPGAHAYLDPSTGSMLISAIVGLLASIALAVKTYWYRIKSFFSRKVPDSDTASGKRGP